MSAPDGRVVPAIPVPQEDLDQLLIQVAELIKWKHAAGPLCPRHIGMTIFHLSVLGLRIQARLNEQEVTP